MTLIAMGEARVLIDCGSAPPSYRIPQEALDVETVLLTHAHNDHISGLPRLLKEGRVRPFGRFVKCDKIVNEQGASSHE
jgi:glyoxylase-like metal-dependent hydrolase (beta-lactamase superfamily II)